MMSNKSKQTDPRMGYFALEEYLYTEGKDKPLEIKSAMIWGALVTLCKSNYIEWDAVKRMYGEFMSKAMDLR